MKKLLSIFLLLTLSFAFSACGDSDDEPEKFVWGGDWNNPSDPNYKAEYNGKYNPIQGLWKNNSDGTKGVYFSEDFKAYTVIFFSNGYYQKDLWRPKYVINDKSYSVDPPAGEIWRYKIEGNQLKDTYRLNDDEKWTYYTKIEE